MKKSWIVRNKSPAAPSTSHTSARLSTKPPQSVCGSSRPPSVGIEQQHERRQRPDREQHDLAPQVVADLDLFLALVREVIDRVVVLRLEEEVADLPRPHRNEPTDERRDAGVEREQHVRRQEAERAQKMQRLIDAAVV
jgi:hypothetical protein